MAKITLIPLFKNLSLSAGDAGTSDPIDLRDCAENGYFSLFHRSGPGTSGTCGTTVFTYRSSPLRDGTYIAPAGSLAIGTAGSDGTFGSANLWTFEPELTPWMKIIATQTGAGTTGANTKLISAELIVQ